MTSRLAEAYVALAHVLKSRAASGDISASVMTQVTDIELECDGFMNYDRTLKFTDTELKRIHDAHRAIVARANFTPHAALKSDEQRSSASVPAGCHILRAQCLSDNAKSRTLPSGITVTPTDPHHDSMTPEVCAVMCAAKGLPWCGVELGVQCFGASAPGAADSASG